LLGALGCGATLLRLVIEELELGGQYDYIVLQATDNAIGFYENEGFVRVGAIARPDQEAMAIKALEAQARAEARAREAEQRRAKLAEERQRERANRERQFAQDLQRMDGAWKAPTLRALLTLDGCEEEKVLERSNQWRDRTVYIKSMLQGNLQEGNEAIRFVEPGQVVRALHEVIRSEFFDPQRSVDSEAQEASYRYWTAFEGAWAKLGNAEAKHSMGTGFFLYVDHEWRPRQLYRLFEVFDLDTHGAGVLSGAKMTVRAREWVMLEGKAGEIGSSFVPRSPKAQKLSWSPRRSKDGTLQTAVLPVSTVYRGSGTAAAEIESGSEVVQLLGLTDHLVSAYAKLSAFRAFEALKDFRTAEPASYPAAAAAGCSAPAPEGPLGNMEDPSVGDEGDALSGMAAEVSEYELQRKRRMEENRRIMMQSGILEASRDLESVAVDTAAPASGGATGERPTKRTRASEGGDAAMVPRDTRSSFARTSEALERALLSDSETPIKPLAGAEGSTSWDAAPSTVASRRSDITSADAQRNSGREPAVEVATEPIPESGRYEASENETPRGIAKRFGVNLDRLVQMNKADYPSLIACSRMKKGSWLRLPRPGDRCEFVPASRLPTRGDNWSAYCHWTFSDQETDDVFPSYMMARRLERRSVASACSADSLLGRLKPRRVDLPPKILSLKELEEARRADQEGRSETEEAEVDEVALPSDWPKNGLYICEEDDRVSQIAKRFGVNADLLVENNRSKYPALNKVNPLRCGTALQLPPPKSAREVIFFFDNQCVLCFISAIYEGYIDVINAIQNG
jgi:hypothetical protein